MPEKIIFNWFPPADCRWPSPSGSILKSFLHSHEITMDIKYWNILLKPFQDSFTGSDINSIDDLAITLLPFFNYISLYFHDEKSYNYIKYKILSYHPQWVNMGKDFIDKQMFDYAKKLDKIIDEEINKLNIEQYFLFGASSETV